MIHPRRALLHDGAELLAVDRLDEGRPAVISQPGLTTSLAWLARTRCGEGSKEIPPVSLSAPYGNAFEPLTGSQAGLGDAC
ncbi:MAG: hypothetical protein LC775_06380 [Acidobacteria bacterium]|nr:hypothetical protein [Acidobacteriota bacterium]